MESFQNDIATLVTQLEKLMKVINHSDPSAQELQHRLHRKYQTTVAFVATKLKDRFIWNDIKETIEEYFQNNSQDIQEMETREKILKKLLRDFEEEFISTPELQEFSEPDPAHIRELNRYRKQKKRQNEANIKLSYRQRHAKSELQKVIDAINRLDPKKLEKTITKTLSRNKSG